MHDSAAPDTEPVTPALEWIADAAVMVGAPIEIGRTPTGQRRLIPILGGELRGPRLRGSVLPGGLDVQFVRDDGVAELEAHYALALDDGTRVYVLNRGLRVASAEDTARLMRGEAVDPARVHFRCTPRFEVAEGPWRWLMRGVFAGTGVRRPDRVELRFFRVG